MDWRFLLDENVDPKTARYLEKEDVYVEHVQGALGLGADDTEEILPYARENDLIVVTSDVSDFGRLDPATHAGVVLLYDDTMRAYRIATGAFFPPPPCFGHRPTEEARSVAHWAPPSTCLSATCSDTFSSSNSRG